MNENLRAQVQHHHHAGKQPYPVVFKNKDNDSSKIVYIWNAERLRSETKDSATKLQSLIGDVEMQEDNTFFYCDSVVLNPAQNIVEAFGNVQMNDSDTTNIYSQYMKYLTDKKMVYFNKEVKLTDGKGTLLTQDLQYDMNQKIGIYSNGGKVINKTTTLTSKEGTYYSDTKDIYFRKDVVLIDPQYQLRADSLLYNTQYQLATFITKTTIIDSSGSTIVTKEGNYDLKNHKALFNKRATIKQGSQTIIGDVVNIDEATGKSTATGNAIYKDSVQNISILANKLSVDQKTNTFVATENPLAIIKQDKDSVYIVADTLFSGIFHDSLMVDSTIKKDTAKSLVKIDAKSTSDSGYRYLQGYHHVKIFSDSMQSVSDSLYYSAKDSTFRLFTNPIVWVNGNQITGDTIFLFMENKKPKRLYVFENAILVNRVAPNMYNQIKGTTINGYFINGAIDYMHAKGSAECYYYAQDEGNAFVGVNHSTADVIDMYFKEKGLSRVVLRSDADGTMYPFKQVVFDDMRLRGFRWLDAKRPKSKFELFETAK